MPTRGAKCERRQPSGSRPRLAACPALGTLGERESGTARLDEAVAAYTEAISADPKYADAYLGRCWARVIVVQQLQQALADCNESLRIQPNDAYTLEPRVCIFEARPARRRDRRFQCRPRNQFEARELALRPRPSEAE